ncbi:MAG: hypothetical protein JW772_04060 [Candidatus Diapherotrites archaeon]|nr:hypothetical protein [Candidatus Diapherotrites archaeon]
MPRVKGKPIPSILKSARGKKSDPRLRDWSKHVVRNFNPRDLGFDPIRDIPKGKEVLIKTNSARLLIRKIRGSLKLRQSDQIGFVGTKANYYLRVSSPSGTARAQYFLISNPEVIRGLEYLKIASKK